MISRLPTTVVLFVTVVHGAFNALAGYDPMVQYQFGVTTACLTALSVTEFRKTYLQLIYV